ncbi:MULTISPECIES: LuxE/PaaK family acyltransferase [Olivibacter]|jgi:phenylacetate-coenzyme A ligase PaaK-like adenylate-forming protein|uniref:Acyl transferase n=1 Tax=Olivibacter oleidegradans TaxID=760123 RepID=A0ABV6HL24_9SPHI|nr:MULTISPECIES: acyl transferase [Olivibacter]MDM8175641.1 acyl transferase [Olivibacter sp. 47]QEL02381.1 acyl transferase [Olivibacter sp. LS-1]
MVNIDKRAIFQIRSSEQFEQVALQIFKKQALENAVYKEYLDYLNCNPNNISHTEEIPFLPIEFFKTKEVILNNQISQVIFSSSGTTGMQPSRHLVSDLSLYEESFRRAFRLFYGDIKNMALLALLPSYLEREGSSLIYMVDDLIKDSNPQYSGYFLYDHRALYERLKELQNLKIPTMLIGVTYALLDFVENYNISFKELIVMETGGMKGKRKEMIRDELHNILCTGFGVTAIHSEYGMTELLSQAYSEAKGVFACPPWMKVLIRDVNDPLTKLPKGLTGGVNIIDLANLNSCSFIATQDLGRVSSNNHFEILGRFDQSDIRGCNLLVQ